jgi:uncharacterized membrane protein
MSDDDDIARLLREVDAATSGKAKPAPSGGEVARRESTGEVAPQEESKLGTLEHLLIAAAGGALVTFLVFLIPFIGSFGILSRALAGAVGGATGYAIARVLMKRGDNTN